MKLLFGLLLFFSVGCTKVAPSNANKSSDTKNKRVHNKLAKTRGFLNVSIDEQSRDKDYLYLEAIIQPNRNMNGNIAEWKVPDHVKVSEGSLEENVDLYTGQQVKYQLVINRETLVEGDKVFFFAYQMQGGERLGSSTNYLYKEKTSEEQLESQTLEKREIQKKKLLQ